MAVSTRFEQDSVTPWSDSSAGEAAVHADVLGALGVKRSASHVGVAGVEYQTRSGRHCIELFGSRPAHRPWSKSYAACFGDLDELAFGLLA